MRTWIAPFLACVVTSPPFAVAQSVPWTLTISTPAPALVAPEKPLRSGQALTPAPGTRPEGAEGEPLLTLDEALTIALADNRGVRAAGLEVGRAGDRIGAAQTRRLPGLRIGLGADYPMVPIDLQFFAGDFGTFPGIGPVPSRDTTLSTQRWLAAATAAVIQPLAQQ